MLEQGPGKAGSGSHERGAGRASSPPMWMYGLGNSASTSSSTVSRKWKTSSLPWPGHRGWHLSSPDRAPTEGARRRPPLETDEQQPLKARLRCRHLRGHYRACPAERTERRCSGTAPGAQCRAVTHGGKAGGVSVAHRNVQHRDCGTHGPCAPRSTRPHGRPIASARSPSARRPNLRRH